MFITTYYNQRLLPPLVHRVCSSRLFHPHRLKTVSQAHGHVLEIGIGSGLNLPHYREDTVSSVTGIDPNISETTERLKQNSLQKPNFELQLIAASAETLPFPDNHFDCAVVTYALCTIPDVLSCLVDLRRSLKPGASLFFSEHGIAPHKSIQTMQRFIHPLWKSCGGGCHINRDIPDLISASGFQITNMTESYLGNFPNIGFNYRGIAKKV